MLSSSAILGSLSIEKNMFLETSTASLQFTFVKLLSTSLLVFVYLQLFPSRSNFLLLLFYLWVVFFHVVWKCVCENIIPVWQKYNLVQSQCSWRQSLAHFFMAWKWQVKVHQGQAGSMFHLSEEGNHLTNPTSLQNITSLTSSLSEIFFVQFKFPYAGHSFSFFLLFFVLLNC